MAKSSVKTIGLLTILSIVNLIGGVFYSIIQIRTFGADRVIEIFFAAQSLMYLISSLSQSGQLSEIFLPIYIGLKQDFDKKIASKAFSLMLNRLSIYILFIIFVIYFVSPFVVKLFIPGFTEANQDQAVLLFRCFLPLIFLQVIGSFFNTILNAESIYGRVELTSFVNVLISIFLIITYASNLGIWILLIISYLGIILQVVTSIFFLYRKKIKYSTTWTMGEFNHKELFKTFYSTIRYASSTQLLNWSLTSAMSFFPEGVYALYNYVNMIISKITNVFVQPLSIIFFTKISTSINDKIRIQDLYNRAQKFGFYIGFLFFTFLISSGYELLAFFLGNKKFSDQNILDAYYILIPFSVSFIFQNWFSLNRKIAVSHKNAKLFYNVATIMMLISAATSFTLIYFFKFWGLIASILIMKILFLISPYVVNATRKTINMRFNYIFRLGFLSLIIIVVSQYIEDFVNIHVEGNFLKMITSLGITCFVGIIGILIIARQDAINIVKTIKRIFR